MKTDKGIVFSVDPDTQSLHRGPTYVDKEGNTTRPKVTMTIPNIEAVVTAFMNLEVPCFFPACSTLRDSLREKIEQAGGKDCHPGILELIREHYTPLVAKAWTDAVRANSSASTHRKTEGSAYRRFLDPDEPCFFEGCDDLRKQLMDAIKEAGGSECPSCTKGNLEAQYAERAQVAWDQQNPPKDDNEPTLS